MAASSSPTNFVGLSGVRIVVVGDVGTWKSSLIVAAATESFLENVPSVLPPTRLPADYYPDRIPLTIIDTSSSPASKATLVAECQSADVVVLTYACDRPTSLDRLSSYWLPELRRLEMWISKAEYDESGPAIMHRKSTLTLATEFSSWVAGLPHASLQGSSSSSSARAETWAFSGWWCSGGSWWLAVAPGSWRMT
ncbi:Actin-1 [Platanthera guangdongensis]|uniref:Actin-1 n=1 Tax=Platanthera guangdongensis TaxID=2320717 RepID=A0ABR2MLE5_9ASPA